MGCIRSILTPRAFAAAVTRSLPLSYCPYWYYWRRHQHTVKHPRRLIMLIHIYSICATQTTAAKNGKATHTQHTYIIQKHRNTIHYVNNNNNISLNINSGKNILALILITIKDVTYNSNNTNSTVPRTWSRHTAGNVAAHLPLTLPSAHKSALKDVWVFFCSHIF